MANAVLTFTDASGNPIAPPTGDGSGIVVTFASDNPAVTVGTATGSGDEATATITLAPATYVRRFGGRITTEDALAAEGTSLEGDRVLGAAVVTAMAVMI